jgi:hypothetical protein
MRRPDFWVNIAVAVGTVGAVWAALFGKWFQSKVFPAKLSLSLDNPEGELIPEGPRGGPPTEQARW